MEQQQQQDMRYMYRWQLEIMVRDHGLEQCLQWLYDIAREHACNEDQTEESFARWSHDAATIDRAISRLSTAHLKDR